MANRRREPTTVIRVPVALLDDIKEMVRKHREGIRGNEMISGEISFVQTLPEDVVDDDIENTTIPLTGRFVPETAA